MCILMTVRDRVTHFDPKALLHRQSRIYVCVIAGFISLLSSTCRCGHTVRVVQDGVDGASQVGVVVIHQSDPIQPDGAVGSASAVSNLNRKEGKKYRHFSYLVDNYKYL